MNEMLYIARHSDQSPLHLIGHLYLFMDYLTRSSASRRMMQSGKIRDFYIREAISFVEQNFQNNITVEDIAGFCNLNRSYFGKIFRDAMGKSPQEFLISYRMTKAAELLNRLGLDPAMRVKSMSKGMVEKLSLTLTMARRAKLYVLDEPIGGVDPAARELILDTILNNYSEDGSILLSTHLIGDVERIFDTVVFLKEGQIALCDDVDAVREKNGMSIDQLFREVFKC